MRPSSLPEIDVAQVGSLNGGVFPTSDGGLTTLRDTPVLVLSMEGDFWEPIREMLSLPIGSFESEYTMGYTDECWELRMTMFEPSFLEFCVRLSRDDHQKFLQEVYAAKLLALTHTEAGDHPQAMLLEFT